MRQGHARLRHVAQKSGAAARPPAPPLRAAWLKKRCRRRPGGRAAAHSCRGSPRAARSQRAAPERPRGPSRAQGGRHRAMAEAARAPLTTQARAGRATRDKQGSTRPRTRGARRGANLCREAASRRGPSKSRRPRARAPWMYAPARGCALRPFGMLRECKCAPCSKPLVCSPLGRAAAGRAALTPPAARGWRGRSGTAR